MSEKTQSARLEASSKRKHAASRVRSDECGYVKQRRDETNEGLARSMACGNINHPQPPRFRNWLTTSDSPVMRRCRRGAVVRGNRVETGSVPQLGMLGNGLQCGWRYKSAGDGAEG